MSVAENLFLGREIRTRIGFIDSTRTHNEARRLLDRVGVDVPTTALIRNLGTGQRQLVEIAKALGVDAKLLILDEPTAALSQREAEKLFALIRELSQAGVGMIYVSHRLEEIASLADRVTVLRDGKSIGTYMARELDRRKVVSLIMGHEQTPSKRDIPRPREKGPILLETRGLTRNGEFDDVSISVRRGEVTVLTGLVGSGRTELLETIFGARRPDAGEIRLNDKPVRISRPQDAIEAGIALIPEDRRGQGLAVTMPVFANITMASLRRFTRRHLLDVRQELEHARKMIVRLAIKVPHPAMRASTLSGGNQQKVVLAKWLSTSAELFLFDEPTLGVDVGAKEELYRLIDGLAANGKGVLVCSSDFEEVMEIADRIIPVRKGRVVADLVNQDLEPSVVMEAIVHGSDS
jgi:ribose transport system ATP-binding protein